MIRGVEILLKFSLSLLFFQLSVWRLLYCYRWKHFIPIFSSFHVSAHLTSTDLPECLGWYHFYGPTSSLSSDNLTSSLSSNNSGPSRRPPPTTLTLITGHLTQSRPLIPIGSTPSRSLSSSTESFFYLCQPSSTAWLFSFGEKRTVIFISVISLFSHHTVVLAPGFYGSFVSWSSPSSCATSSSLSSGPGFWCFNYNLRIKFYHD